MSSIRAVSATLLNYLTTADGFSHVALVVTEGKNDAERIVAEAVTFV
jgi:hypothetical protein